MSASERSEPLERLLQLVDAHIDTDWCGDVDSRYRRALAGEATDRPPLVIQSGFGGRWRLPPPWDEFETYPYRQTFDEPAAMLHNQLLNWVVPGLILGDDNPLAIRSNHGTVQIASYLGGDWRLHEDDYPWVRPLTSRQAVHDVINTTDTDCCDDLMQRSQQTMLFYREKLSRHPRCAQAIQIALPDLQGPMDTAEQLWGGELLMALIDEPGLVNALMARIVAAMIRTIALYRPLTSDRLDPAANTQHGYNIPGRLLIRDDSSILVSPQTYLDVIRPWDERLLAAVGGGSIHFCGNGEHLIETMLEIPRLHGIDVGESAALDIDRVYACCRARRVAVTNIRPGRAALTDGEAVKRFPTGAVFVYTTEDIADAQEVIAAYKSEDC